MLEYFSDFRQLKVGLCKEQLKQLIRFMIQQLQELIKEFSLVRIIEYLL